jgi:hypothetical protein
LPKIIIENTIDASQPSTNAGSIDKMKNIKNIVRVIAVFLLIFAVQKIFFKNYSIDKEMMAAASEINKSCPVMVDSETRLDNSIALPNNVFQYNYTLVNVEKGNVDTVSMKNYLEPNITNFVKSSPQMQYQRDNKCILNYCYKDKRGLYLFLITVTPDMYNAK